MTQKDFDVYLPGHEESPSEERPSPQTTALRKFTARLLPGKSSYEIAHNLETMHVIVQTSIAGNVREGGVSISDRNTVRVSFGGTLNEPIDVVIIG